MVRPLLSIASLRCSRDGRLLFGDLDLEIGPGEAVSLVGPNGSGKSTLLRCIAGLYPDYEGTIEAEEAAYLGHRPGISARLTPLENLRWYAGITAVQGQDIDEALEGVGLAGYEHHLCAQLSAGQQRRVALARLVLDRQPLWLLDEPLTALDADGQALVRTLIERHLDRGGGALVATHQGLGLTGSRTLRLGGERL